MKASRLQFRYSECNSKSRNTSLEYPVPIACYSKLITPSFSYFHPLESRDYPKLKYPNYHVNILKECHDQVPYQRVGDLHLAKQIAKIYQSKLHFHKVSLGRSISSYVSD